MADTTNDIWNDNDGEEDEAPRKGGRLRRFGIFFLVLAAVLGVVLVGNVSKKIFLRIFFERTARRLSV